ncbi:hypothetical protein BJY52DRAFT_1117179, partial [Lactarius psammicola]
ENMAQAVWETLTQYGLIGQVIMFVMDNTANNDTLLRAIEKRCDEVNIYFSATEPCELMLFQLLEGIGTLSKVDAKKALLRSSNYQDSAVAPLDRKHNNDTVQLEDEPEDQEDSEEQGPATILSAITKLWRIIWSVWSSPQQRQKWYKEIYVTMNQGSAGNEGPSPALMLILDVQT